MNIYIVEDSENSPGRILAVFAHEEDALAFSIMLPMANQVLERNLWYGQPPIQGVND